MPKVSIIIPFNNVEDYIEQCLDSVLTQSLKDIEIILVNDASTDKSRKIVEKYADKDKRIKIIDIKEHRGQGYARNRAIEVATGEYIGFVDSDDFIEQDMFESLYSKAKSDDTDITMCQVREYDDINEYYITSDYYSLEPLVSFGDKVFSAEDTKEQILDINVALWNKIYKREYLLGIGEKFPEGFIYEDLPFFFGTYLPAKKINIVWKNLYSYRVNRKNSTMQQFNDKILDRLPMVSLTYEKLKSFMYLSDLKQRIQSWIINDLFHRYTLLNESYHKEYFFLMKRVFENLEIENVDDDYWKRVYHFEGYLLVINNSFEKFNQAVFNEYLDIHKVEDRLQSQIIEFDEIDRRFGLIYDDLNRVYKYSENIVDDAKKQLTMDVDKKIDEELNKLKITLREDIGKDTEANNIQLINQTDEKISKVYEEISKNYEYTNNQSAEVKENIQGELQNKIENIKTQTDEKISKVYEEISKNYEYTNNQSAEVKENIQGELQNKIENINTQTDEKISKVYEEISKNYEYTNEIVGNFDLKTSEIYQEITNNYEFTKRINKDLDKQLKEKTKDLYNDIRDLSFVIQDNFVELSKEQKTIKDEYKNIVEDISKLNDEKVNEKIFALNEKIDKIAFLIDEQKNSNEKEISKLVQKFEEDKKQTNEFIAEMKVEFVAILREEQIRHKEEILEFKHQIRELEYDLREEIKSPIKKLIEKYQNKQVK